MNKHTEIVNNKKEFEYTYIASTIGIDPSNWDKQIRSYFITILADLLSIRVTEVDLKALSRSYESASQSNRTIGDQSFGNAHPSRQASPPLPNTDRIRKKFLANYSKAYPRIEISSTNIKAVAFMRYFIGIDYKVPVAFSLLSINNNKVIGIKASIFSLNNIHEKNYFMPVTLNEPWQQTEAFLENTIYQFKNKMEDIQKSFFHITPEPTFEIKGPKNYQNEIFDPLIVMPFERILQWYNHSIASIEEMDRISERKKSNIQTKRVRFGHIRLNTVLSGNG